jgi:hypothetical protein
VPSEDPPPRDELMLKMLLAIELGPEHALAVITKHRTALTTLLQRRRRAASEQAGGSNGTRSGEELAAALVADALIVRAEADLRWLDLCEARLTATTANSKSAVNGQKAAT